MSVKTKTEETGAAEAVFTKEQIAGSERFRSQKDLVNAILKDGQSYSFAETDSLLKAYMKGKVT